MAILLILALYLDTTFLGDIMPVDSNIALSVRPVESPNQLAQYAQLMAIQNAGNQNALAQYSLGRAKREDEVQNALAAAYRGAVTPDGSIDYNKLTGALAGGAAATSIPGVLKSRNEQQKSEADLDKVKLDNIRGKLGLLGGALAPLAQNPTREAVMGTLANLKAQGVDPAPIPLPANDADLPRWIAAQAAATEHGLKALEAYTPKVTYVDSGGARVAVNQNPLAGPIGPMAGVAEIAKTVTPDAALQRSTQVSEGALNRGVQVRGQNMLDTRSRENAALVDNRMRLNAGLTDTGALTAESEAMARGIASGQLAPLSSFALNRPGGRAVMSRVMELNPEYSAKDYAVGLNGIKGFTTGKQGDVVRSFNVGISHLNTLEELADALQNGDVQAVNKAGNFIAKQTGAPAPTNFNAAKQIVADEIVKAVIGGRGALGDRQEAAKTISDASSPEQLKGVIRTYKSLMNGQLQGLKQQYEQSTGRKDFDRFLMTQEGASSATTNKPSKPTANDFFRN